MVGYKDVELRKKTTAEIFSDWTFLLNCSDGMHSGFNRSEKSWKISFPLSLSLSLSLSFVSLSHTHTFVVCAPKSLFLNLCWSLLVTLFKFLPCSICSLSGIGKALYVSKTSTMRLSCLFFFFLSFCLVSVYYPLLPSKHANTIKFALTHTHTLPRTHTHTLSLSQNHTLKYAEYWSLSLYLSYLILVPREVFDALGMLLPSFDCTSYSQMVNFIGNRT